MTQGGAWRKGGVSLGVEEVEGERGRRALGGKEAESRGNGGQSLGKARREMTEISKTRLFPQTNQSPDTKMAGSLVKARNRGVIPPSPSTPGVCDAPAPQPPLPAQLLEGVGPAGEEGRGAVRGAACAAGHMRVRGPGLGARPSWRGEREAAAGEKACGARGDGEEQRWRRGSGGCRKEKLPSNGGGERSHH